MIQEEDTYTLGVIPMEHARTVICVYIYIHTCYTCECTGGREGAASSVNTVHLKETYYIKGTAPSVNTLRLPVRVHLHLFFAHLPLRVHSPLGKCTQNKPTQCQKRPVNVLKAAKELVGKGLHVHVCQLLR